MSNSLNPFGPRTSLLTLRDPSPRASSAAHRSRTSGMRGSSGSHSSRAPARPWHETAAALPVNGAQVVLAVRNLAKGKKVADRIRLATPEHRDLGPKRRRQIDSDVPEAAEPDDRNFADRSSIPEPNTAPCPRSYRIAPHSFLAKWMSLSL